MSIITIPNPKTKAFVQPNTSDVVGSLFVSKNLDLQENYGRMRLGRRLVVNSDSSDSGLSDLYNPVAFVAFNSKIYTLGGESAGKVYVSGTQSLHSSFTADASSNAPAEIVSSRSDMVFGSNGNLYATGSTKLYECAAGVWNATTRALSSGVHMLTVFQNRIYVSTLGNAILSSSIATSTFGALNSVGDDYALQLSIDTDSTIITFLRASASRIWIGTVNTKGGKGYVYEWDGASNSFTRSYRLESSGALSCVIKDEIPYIVDTNGDLLYWNGGTFMYLAGFNRRGKRTRLAGATNANNTRFIHPNGMSIVDGKINILINNLNGDNGGTVEDTIISGIWEYTQTNGLVHKHSFGLTKASDTIIDYGQNRIARAGAIAELIVPSNAVGSSTNGSFFAGAAVYTDATTVKALVAYEDSNDTLQKGGYFITPKFDSGSVTETWQSVHAKYRRFLNSSDRIILKFRTYEVEPVEATITWTSTTTFTTTASVGSFAIGDEIEIIQGLGSGKTAHITAISYSNPTYTVTVDETFTSATGTSKARFDKWVKLGVVDDQTFNHKKFKFTKNQTETWIQFKVCMFFTGKGEYESISVATNVDQPTT